MDIAEKIYQEASRLPEHLAQKVLDFIESIEKKQGLGSDEIQNLMKAQTSVMNRVWDNENDEVWNEHPAC
jgi:hypothetical protein